MPKSFSPPPPAYDLHSFKSSTIQLTTNEVAQSKEKLREKNAKREGSLRTSAFGSFMHVIKGCCGSGFLAMPDAFHNIGLLLGSISTVIVTIICAHCTHILELRASPDFRLMMR